MGNCMDFQKKAVSWVDYEEEEWEYESIEYKKSKKARANAAKGRDDDDDMLRPLKEEDLGAGATEIKIRISKKQLEKMLQQQAGSHGGSLRLQEVLTDLMSLGEVVQEQQHIGHWRPKLQSIAE